jgi:hypothetical protein
LLATGVGQPKIEQFPHRDGPHTKGDVRPRADRQARRSSSCLQCPKIAKLAWQEDVVPAADRTDWHGDLGHTMAVIDDGPPWRFVVAGEDILEVIRAAADRDDIRPVERQHGQRAALFSNPQHLMQDCPRLFLPSDLNPPTKRRFEGESVFAEKF